MIRQRGAVSLYENSSDRARAFAKFTILAHDLLQRGRAF